MPNLKKNPNYGKIYVVATPIGNLADFSPRAQAVLKTVDVIAAEDTRHSQKLLQHFGIKTFLTSYHQYNEKKKSIVLLEQIKSGKNLALISDAGTPLLSDPGFHLIRAAHQANLEVIVVPGPCAAIAALSIAGVACDKYIFLGFLPIKGQARRAILSKWGESQLSVVFYEAPHRLKSCLSDMAQLWPERQIALARELTKLHEQILHGTASQLLLQLQQHPLWQKGEFVVILAPLISSVNENNQDEELNCINPKLTLEIELLLKLLLAEMPLKKAVDLVTKLTDGGRNKWYRLALELKNEGI